ncbi:hypothetical protein D3C81_1393540 [compost metagenome]
MGGEAHHVTKLYQGRPQDDHAVGADQHQQPELGVEVVGTGYAQQQLDQASPEEQMRELQQALGATEQTSHDLALLG